MGSSLLLLLLLLRSCMYLICLFVVATDLFVFRASAQSLICSTLSSAPAPGASVCCYNSSVTFKDLTIYVTATDMNGMNGWLTISWSCGSCISNKSTARYTHTIQTWRSPSKSTFKLKVTNALYGFNNINIKLCLFLSFLFD
jgi:hypothetical protein